LDGYAASHRAVREMKADGQLLADKKVRSAKYLNNLIEQDHRGVKLRIGPMLGFKWFRTAAITIAGIELLHRIQKGQLDLRALCLKDRTAPAVWKAELAALQIPLFPETRDGPGLNCTRTLQRITPRPDRSLERPIARPASVRRWGRWEHCMRHGFASTAKSDCLE
jgi:hypothetical protein